MNERTQGALLLAVGAIAIRLGLTDAALAYVKAGLQPFLVAAGAVLLALGAGALVRGFRDRPGEPGAAGGAGQAQAHPAPAGEGSPEPAVEAVVVSTDAHGHSHERGPVTAWLLLAPLLALLLVAPPALGSYAAERQSTRPPVSTETRYPPLPEPVDGAVELRLIEYVFRALYDEERSLDGQRVRLAGFVTASDDGATYYLTRFRLACCAADATAITVEIAGDRVWEADTWLEVEGYWREREGGEVAGGAPRPPVLEAETSREIPVPSQTYEY